MEYILFITRDITISREDTMNLKQKCYAKMKQEFFSLKYEHVILEDLIGELALLIACTKLVGENLKESAESHHSTLPPSSLPGLLHEHEQVGHQLGVHAEPRQPFLPQPSMVMCRLQISW